MRTSRALTGLFLSLAGITSLPGYESSSSAMAPDCPNCTGIDDSWTDCGAAWPRFIVRGGALVLRPQSRGPVPLVTGSNAVLQAADLDFKFQAGWEISGIW